MVLGSAAASSPPGRCQMQQREGHCCLPVARLISEVSAEEPAPAPRLGRVALPWKCSVPGRRSALGAELERGLHGGSESPALS